MIEKFTDEELKQILTELNFPTTSAKESVCKEQIVELKVLWKDKGFETAHRAIFRIIDYTLNNCQSVTKLNRSVQFEDRKEYGQMYQEILEIIKKHNRKLNDGIVKTE